jgi:ferredoxin
MPGGDWPSDEWLHGFADGQAFLNQLGRHLKVELIKAGYGSLVPSSDERFWGRTGFNNSLPSDLLYTSNWSERHAAFVCGLGTFGLSEGLITSKGMAGRFGSIITEMYLSPDRREYQNVDECCTRCGKCAKNCPVNAISLEEGKNHSICSKFLGQILEKYWPRYGCGKCQINVPCESKIPQKNNENTN